MIVVLLGFLVAVLWILFVPILDYLVGELVHRRKMRAIEEDGLRRLVKTFDDKESHDEADRKM
jgi:uncharacterized protein YqgC (DUF456 family)